MKFKIELIGSDLHEGFRCKIIWDSKASPPQKWNPLPLFDVSDDLDQKEFNFWYNFFSTLIFFLQNFDFTETAPQGSNRR